MLLRRLALSVVTFVFTLAVALFCAPRCLAQNCAKRVDPLGFVIGVSATSSNGADPCSSVNMRMAETSGPWTIRKRVDEVMVFFTVTNGRNFVNDLTQREVYVNGLANVLESLPTPKRFLFVSSTSVYGQSDGGWVTEASPTEPRDGS